MQRLQGIAVSPGVAIGEALVMGNEGFRIPRRFVARDAVDDELRASTRPFAAAAARNRPQSRRRLASWAISTAPSSKPTCKCSAMPLRAELDAHSASGTTRPNMPSAAPCAATRKVFQSLDNSYMAERATDILDIEKRLLRNLLGRRREEISSLTSPVLVLAHTPYAQRGRQSRSSVRPRLRHRTRGLGQPHRDRRPGAGNSRRSSASAPFLTDVSGGDW